MDCGDSEGFWVEALKGGDTGGSRKDTGEREKERGNEGQALGDIYLEAAGSLTHGRNWEAHGENGFLSNIAGVNSWLAWEGKTQGSKFSSQYFDLVMENGDAISWSW